eukprot:2222738-Pleurochrysis_carterae.AAC.2
MRRFRKRLLSSALAHTHGRTDYERRFASQQRPRKASPSSCRRAVCCRERCPRASTTAARVHFESSGSARTACGFTSDRMRKTPSDWMKMNPAGISCVKCTAMPAARPQPTERIVNT